MTSSSSPGNLLKQEGISYIACAELPCVIVKHCARRPRSWRNTTGAERLFPVYKGRRTRRLPSFGAGAGFRSGGGGFYLSGL